MKKKLVVIISLLLVAAAALSLVGCADMFRVGSKLDMPTPVTYDDESRILSWTAVDGAVGYEIKIFVFTDNDALNSDENAEERSQLSKGADETTLDLSEWALPIKIWVRAVAEDSVRNSGYAFYKVPYVLASVDEPTSVPDVPPEEEERFNAFALDKAIYYVLGGDDLVIDLGDGGDAASVRAKSDLSMDGKWSCADGRLKIDGDYLDGYSDGASVSLEIRLENGEEYEKDIKVVIKPPYAFSNLPEEGYYYAYRNGSREVSVTLDLESEKLSSALIAVTIDNRRLAQKSSSAQISNYTLVDSTIGLRAQVFNNLEVGTHVLGIVTDRGVSEALLLVVSKEFRPYDVSFDIDSSYPKVLLKWDINTVDVDRYTVSVDGGMTYSSDNPDYASRFVGASFDATDLVSVGQSVNVTAYVDGNPYMSAADAVQEEVLDIDASQYAQYLNYEDGFDYLGKQYNYFISSDDEMNVFAWHMKLHYEELYSAAVKAAPVSLALWYDDYKEGVKEGEVSSALLSASATYREAYWNFYTSVTRTNPNLNSFDITYVSYAGNVPDHASTQTGYAESKFNDVHYGDRSGPYGRSDTYDDFAINSVEETMECSLSDELYFAVEAGLRPICELNSAAMRMYNKAKGVLRQIITDDMSDFAKLHAIYDWLCANVIYDYEASKEVGNSRPGTQAYKKFYTYNIFYLEGVFDEGTAVCNGIAKAFTLMAGIEGIESYKVTGRAKSGGQHAWNKVKMGGNWYIFDATWGNKLTDKCESVNHEYMFMTQKKADTTRTESGDYEFSGYYADDTTFDIYANMTFVRGGKLYDYVVDSEEEYLALVNERIEALEIDKRGEGVTLTMRAGNAGDVFAWGASLTTVFKQTITYNNSAGTVTVELIKK